MNIEETFPERFWINLGRRGDRRGETEWMLERTGLTAERFPAVDARFVMRMALERGKDGCHAPCRPEIDGSDEKRIEDAGDERSRTPEELIRGYPTLAKYALALTKRLAVRRARQRGAAAVLLLEDDVVFHPNLRALLEVIELPADWGILYLGCAYCRDPEPAAPGVVRLRKNGVADNHAVAIRAPWFNRVIRALDARGKPDPGHARASDRYLAALADEIPSYAVFPNLAWQAVVRSDLVGARYSNYRKGGTQKYEGSLVERIFENMYGGGRPLRGRDTSRLALMFLTRGDTNHPEIWRE